MFYEFRFSPKQVQERVVADLVMLICEGEKTTFHLFPPDHPVFYTLEGKRKSKITYTPHAKQVYPNSLTDDEMTLAQARWHLVEEARLAVRRTLING